MHQLIYLDLKKIIEKNTYKPFNDEFKINIDNVLKTLEKIKNGDTKYFKQIKPKEFFQESSFNA